MMLCNFQKVQQTSYRYICFTNLTSNCVLMWHANVSKGDNYIQMLQNAPELHALPYHVSKGDNYYLTLQGATEWHALPSWDCLTVSHESLYQPRQRHELWWWQPLQETILLNSLLSLQFTVILSYQLIKCCSFKSIPENTTL